jgi:hypothetical protein
LAREKKEVLLRGIAEKFFRIVLADGTHLDAGSNHGFVSTTIATPDGLIFVIRSAAPGRNLIKGKRSFPELSAPLKDIVRIQFDRWDRSTHATSGVVDIVYTHKPDGTYEVSYDGSRTEPFWNPKRVDKGV